MPAPVETTTSSTKTPGSWKTSSLAYETDTSAVFPANAPRSMLHCSQPPLEPLMAFQEPVVPVGLQPSSSFADW